VLVTLPVGVLLVPIFQALEAWNRSTLLLEVPTKPSLPIIPLIIKFMLFLEAVATYLIGLKI